MNKPSTMLMRMRCDLWAEVVPCGSATLVCLLANTTTSTLTTYQDGGPSSTLRWAGRRPAANQTIQLTDVESQQADVVVLGSSTDSEPLEHDLNVDKKQRAITA